GMQGALDKQSPLPGVVWRVSRSDWLRARARDGELAVVHGCICFTTLGRWHSGQHSQIEIGWTSSN
ncbi:hypothetical protein, partial [Shewanella algae]|uniref:hypothetical protein n=1 Tax=Shewanella algae TaxID=38313 RepID=UPI003003D4C0